MGLPTNIKTLLSGQAVEWARIEFKETWDAEASLKTICAFANDIDNWGGGYLVIGVEDKDGKPTNLKGVPAEKIDSHLKDLLNKCKQIHPEYMPITEVVDYKDRKFIIVWAPGGIIRPYSSPKTMAKGDKERVFAKWQVRLPQRRKKNVNCTTLQIMFPLMIASITKQMLPISISR